MFKFINHHTFTKLTFSHFHLLKESVKQDKSVCFMDICYHQLLKQVIKSSTLITQFLMSLCTRTY